MILFLIASIYWVCMLYIWRKRKKQREELEALIKQNAKRIDIYLNRSYEMFNYFAQSRDIDFYDYAFQELNKAQNLITENEKLIDRIKSYQ